MSEYELADILVSVSGDTLVFIPLFISIFSGYLVVAWIVGEELTRAQVSLVNTLFCAFVLLLLVAWAKRILVVLSYQADLITMNPSRPELVGGWLIPGVTIFMLVALLACLNFMWSIRHAQTK
jgi:hypothetical protein